MVVTYRMSRWSWYLMRRMHLQPWAALPNILAGRFVVPELLQDAATPENLAQAVGNMVSDAAVKADIERVFSALHQQLRQNTAEKAAAAILPYLRPSA
jgi:lipid-A-disaccharide synthase